MLCTMTFFLVYYLCAGKCFRVSHMDRLLDPMTRALVSACSKKIFVHIPHPQCPKTHPTGAFRDERRFKPYKVLIDFVQGKNLVASKVLQMSSSSSSCSCYACPQPRHSPPPGVASKRTSDTWKKISQTNRVSR